MQILATPKMKICNFHPILQIFSKILQIFQKSAKNGLFLHFFLENLQKTNDRQLTEMNKTKDLVSKGKKDALSMFWTNALKYGAAIRVITIPVLYVLLSL